MPTTTVKRFFPHSRASLVYQNGQQQSPLSRGVEVVLHMKSNEQAPSCAEVISGDQYAEIGLSFNGKKLVDYDGVFFLPREVAELLNENGYIVPQEYFA